MMRRLRILVTSRIFLTARIFLTSRTFLTSRMFLTSMIVAAALVPAAAINPAMAAEEVDLLLVLAVDVSRSIDATKFQLQREGYAAAVADPRVLEAIRTGRLGPLAS